MESKLLYAKGNLHTGYPYGVELAIGWFGSTEVHGPFVSASEAHNYAVAQMDARPAPDVTAAKVVKIETPQAEPVISNERGREVSFDPAKGYSVHQGDWSATLTQAQAAHEERQGTPLRDSEGGA